VARLAAVVDLLAHKNPKLRILSFLADEKDESYLADTLRLATTFKRCHSLWRASYAEDGILRFQDYSSNSKPAQSSDRGGFSFDLVILGPAQLSKGLAPLKDLVAPEGALLFAGSSSEASGLEELGFQKSLQSQLGGPYKAVLARRLLEESSDKKGIDSIKGEVLIVSLIRVVMMLYLQLPLY
jgi:hypothetical protein